MKIKKIEIRDYKAFYGLNEFKVEGKNQQTVYRISTTSLQTENSVMTKQYNTANAAGTHIPQPRKPTHRQ